MKSKAFRIHEKVKPTMEGLRRLQHAEETRQADCAVTDFVKGMSHELRTPLNVIIGLCQLLERDRQSSLTAMQRDAIERMERNGRTLLQSVNHLLELLRTGKFERRLF